MFWLASVSSTSVGDFDNRRDGQVRAGGDVHAAVDTGAEALNAFEAERELGAIRIADEHRSSRAHRKPTGCHAGQELAFYVEDVAQAHSNAGRSVVEAEIGLGQIGARIGPADDARADAELGHGTKRPVRIARLGPPITVGDLATSIDATLSEYHVLRRGAHYRAPVIKPLRAGALALILEIAGHFDSLHLFARRKDGPALPCQGLELDRVLDGRRSHVGFGNNGDVRSLRCSQKANFVHVSGAADAIHDEGTSYLLGVIDGRRDLQLPRQLSLPTPARGEERLGARCRSSAHAAAGDKKRMAACKQATTTATNARVTMCS